MYNFYNINVSHVLFNHSCFIVMRMKIIAFNENKQRNKLKFLNK